MRGYSTDSLGTSKSVDIALLVSDLKFLLETLHIAHVHATIGLGFGANIGLELLAHWPSIASTFIGSGFAIPDSPVIPRNTAVDEWRLRSSLAHSFGMGILADKAVARWFTVDARGGSEWARIRYMIASGSVEGMEKLSNAVVESVGHGTDDRGKEILKHLQVPALFICGSGDEALPEEMETYPSMMVNAKGTFSLIDRASRLACCEVPGKFVDVLEDWLRGFFLRL